MDQSHIRPRRLRFAGLFFTFCFFCEYDDEQSLVRLSWLQKVRRSNPRVDSMDRDSQNWWRNGWNSVRHAGDRLEPVIDDAGSCCNGSKWKHIVRRLKSNGKTICGSKPSRFQYDRLSYELNFDHGSGHDEVSHL